MYQEFTMNVLFRWVKFNYSYCEECCFVLFLYFLSSRKWTFIILWSCDQSRTDLCTGCRLEFRWTSCSPDNWQHLWYNEIVLSQFIIANMFWSSLSISKYLCQDNHFGKWESEIWSTHLEHRQCLKQLPVSHAINNF